MAANKYYITNGTEVIGSINNKAYGTASGSIDLAKRFKYTEAINFMRQKMPGQMDWGLQRFFNGSSGRNYIITTATNFAADNGTITTDFAHAKSFRSVADAEAYIRNHRELIRSFGKSYVVNEKLEVADTNERKEFTDEQLNILGVQRNAPRRAFGREKRLDIFEAGNRRCAICGKPVHLDTMTVDHIVPLSRGGGNERENLRCTCERCNKLKGNSLDTEMYTGLANIVAMKIYEDPDNNMWDMLARAKVRGTIKKSGHSKKMLCLDVDE